MTKPTSAKHPPSRTPRRAPLPRFDDLGDDQLIDSDAAGAVLHLDPGTLAAWRWRGIGPAFIKLSGRLVRYRVSALRSWIRSNEAATRYRAVPYKAPPKLKHGVLG